MTRFPTLSVVVVCIAMVSVAALQPSLSLQGRAASCVLVAAFSLWLTFALAQVQGASARERIRAKFRSAVSGGAHAVKVGGVRWIFTDGEFHHLAHDGGERGSLFKAETGFAARHATELGLLKVRRGEFVFLLCASAADGLLAAGGVFPVVTTLIAIITLVGAVGFLWNEYAYRYGLQLSRGAMVLDPPPALPDSSAVQAQKVHGDARLATETETLAAAESGAARRSSVHDQEF